MLDFEEILGIKGNNTIEALANISNTILLIPDALKDAIKKINKLGFIDAKDAEFINGYAVLKNGNFISKKGKMITPEREIYGQFSCDRIQCKGGFIDGLTGKLIKGKILDTKPFANNLAPVKINDDYWIYITKNGDNANYRDYKLHDASCFFGNYAITREWNRWHLINSHFDTIIFGLDDDYTKEQLEGIMKFFDHNPSIYKPDNIAIYQKGETTIFIDRDTGFSIRVYDILERLYQALNIPKIEGTIREQLIYIFNEASTRGTMALNLDTLEIHNVEVVKGIKIIDNLGGCAISFEASDMKLARSLIRSEKKEGE